jgi:hypothetical protein
MEAVVCIFAPALDQFEVPAEISSYGAHSSQLSYCVIYAVIICNFFLVSSCNFFVIYAIIIRKFAPQHTIELLRDLCCNHLQLYQVSLVLINLVIAMMSSTYDNINR